MSKDKNNEVFNYDKVFQKYSKFFINPKYEVYDLEKFIFLIEIKVAHYESIKPKIFDPLKTVWNVVVLYIVLLLCNPKGFSFVFLGASLLYIVLFFMVHFLRTASINRMTKYSKTKKKYLLIKNCIENEILRRKDNDMKNP